MLLNLRKKKTVPVTAMANLQESPHVHSHDLVTLLGLNTALYISPQLGGGGGGGLPDVRGNCDIFAM